MQPLAWVLSDLHVRNNDRIWVNRADLLGDTSFALEQASALIREQPLPVLLAGDNFETKLQRADAIAMMRQFIDTVRETGQPLWFVDGQHDLSVPPLMQAISDWPQHAHKQVITLGQVAIYGLDYQPVDTVAIELKAIPEQTDVLLTHQVWKDLMGEKAGIASLHDVASVQLVISGDYHHEKFMTVATQRGPLGFLSPGPICLQDISEAGERCVFILNDDLTITRVPLKSRKYVDVTISSDEHLEAFIKLDPERLYDRTLPPKLQKCLLHLRYPQNKPEYLSRVSRVFGEHVHLFEKPQTVISMAVSEQEELERTTVLSEAALPEIIAENYNANPIAAQIAIRLVTATSKDDECQRIFDELMRGQDAVESVATR